jgi:ABC-type polysaccharide/polyol phosphate export permease
MAIDANLPLLFHRNVRAIDVFLTRSVLEIAGATGSFAILATFFTSAGWMEAPVDMLQVIFGWIMLSWFGTALALVIGAGTAYSHVVEKLWGPTSYLLFPLSGAAFMVDWLSPGFQKIVLLLPMVHGVEIMREGYFGNTVRTHYDVGYMTVCCLLLSLVALYLVRDAGQKVEGR